MLKAFAGRQDEAFHATYFDNRGRVLAQETLATGDQAQVLVSCRKLFGHALRLDARGMILAHNHPSGTAEPSPADRATTRRVRSIADGLEVEVIDHLIVVSDQVYSMKLGRLL